MLAIGKGGLKEWQAIWQVRLFGLELGVPGLMVGAVLVQRDHGAGCRVELVEQGGSRDRRQGGFVSLEGVGKC